jgi:ATP-dependent Clp protease ATP-binding subunit ClpA
MFEKFTQKAINILQDAQDKASDLGHNVIYSEHILLGIAAEAKGVDMMIFKNAGIDFSKLQEIILKKLEGKQKHPQTREIPFSESARAMLECAMDIRATFKSPLIMPQHLYLALMSLKNSGAYAILSECGANNDVIVANFEKLITKKKGAPKDAQKQEEPGVEIDPLGMLFEGKVGNIFETAVSKLSSGGYEILGTEQIFQSILEDSNSDVAKMLAECGIERDIFASKLQWFFSRDDEYGGRKIIFTPNAFRAMLLAVDAAKEAGSVEINPEHLILGIMRAKGGIAYKIIKDIVPSEQCFEEKLVRHLVKHTQETLSILRFAKKEAKAMAKNTVGTEFILLGILAQNTSIGAQTLEKLGITFKDAKEAVEKKAQAEPPSWSAASSVKSVVYTPRAKALLETAWENAKKRNQPKIMSENILYAIAKQPDCSAMKILSALGTDAIEIAQGIVHELYAKRSEA